MVDRENARWGKSYDALELYYSDRRNGFFLSSLFGKIKGFVESGENNRVPVGYLARRMGVSRKTLSAGIKQLEDDGFIITRYHTDNNQTRLLVKMTDKLDELQYEEKYKECFYKPKAKPTTGRRIKA